MKIKEIIQDNIFPIGFFGTIAIIIAAVLASSNIEKGERIILENGTRVITMDGDTIEVHAYKYNPYAYKVN